MAMNVWACLRRRRKTGGGPKGLAVAAVLLLRCLLARGNIQVSPSDTNWKSTVEAAPDGSTVQFKAGVYTGCNVSLGSGQRTQSTRLAISALLRPQNAFSRARDSRECARGHSRALGCAFSRVRESVLLFGFAPFSDQRTHLIFQG